uniref:DUF5742 domain-containing protein n=1 Tax=Trichobilharzia regenti TaxID=157069 RepID=A0AA85K691_TRIRE|nr:unnamed protein product [Trichobilharzia regenti]
MAPRSVNSSAQISPDILRLLQKSELGLEELKQIHKYAKANPQHLINQTSRLELLITKIINPTECNCSAKTATHFDLSCKNLEIEEKIQLAAECFSMLPFLKSSPQRLQEYQLRLARCLSETLCCLLDINRLSHATLSTVQAYLSSKVDYFSCITPVDKVKKLSEDFSNFLYLRAEFFTYSLRCIFLRDSATYIDICLPVFMSLFNGFFEVKLTENESVSDRLLTTSSRLMLCLSTICQTVGTLIMPAVPCLLTFLTYHLEWTTNWRLDFKRMGYIVRLRLGSISCLINLATKNLKLSYSYFTELMPRIISQLVHDLRWQLCINQVKYSIKPVSPARQNDAFKPPALTVGSFEKRITIAVLTLVDCIFKDPEMLHYITLSESKSDRMIGTKNPLSRTTDSEVNRLLLIIGHLTSQVDAVLKRGMPFVQNKVTNMVLISPPVLSALAKVSFVCAMSIPNQTFLLTVLKFLNNLTRHSDNTLSLTAMGYFHQLSGLKLCKSLRHTNSEPTMDDYEHAQIAHQPRLVMQNECKYFVTKHGSEMHSNGNKSPNFKQQKEEPPVKLPRITKKQGPTEIEPKSSSDESKSEVSSSEQKEPIQIDGKSLSGDSKSKIPSFEHQTIDPQSPGKSDASCIPKDVHTFLTAFDPTFV